MSHLQFKVFASSPDFVLGISKLLNEVENWINSSKVAARSVGIEYVEFDKKLYLSVGYVASAAAAFPVKLTAVDLGALNGIEAIGNAFTAAAQGADFVCHEFFVTPDGNFVMVLLQRA